MTNTTTPAPVVSITVAPNTRGHGRGLAIAGFVLSLLGALSPLGLAFSVIAFAQARRAGAGNGLALAGIVVGAIATAVLAAVAVYSVETIAQSAELCSVKALIDGTCR